MDAVWRRNEFCQKIRNMKTTAKRLQVKNRARAHLKLKTSMQSQ